MKNMKTSNEKTNTVIKPLKICKGKVSEINLKNCSNTMLELDIIATTEIFSEFTLDLSLEILRQL